jgi:hypothetical protein
MAQGTHLGDQVEIITDKFAASGAPRGSVGVIVDDWSDGSNDIEVSDAKTGEIVARIRATEAEVKPYSGPIATKEPRKHGILFGRGDELGDDVEEPPMSGAWGAITIPGYAPAPIAFSTPPAEDAKLTGEIPWELREQPPSGPILH